MSINQFLTLTAPAPEKINKNKYTESDAIHLICKTADVEKKHLG